MRVGIRTKQVAGVMAIVGLALTLLGGWYLAALTEILLESSRTRAKLVANVIYQRTFTVYGLSAGDWVAALREDSGLRNILESSVAYGDNLDDAAICDADNRVLVNLDSKLIGTQLPPLTPANDINDLIDRQGVLARFKAIWWKTPGMFEYEMQLGTAPRLGSIRITVNTWLLREELFRHLKTPLFGAAAVLIASIVVAVFLAQLVLRPIHVIRSGLARLGRGEHDVNVELPPDAELTDLGASFRQVTARLAATRTDRDDKHVIESFVEQLEDAVAVFGSDGTLRFSNSAMDTALGLPSDTPSEVPDSTLESLLPADHPYRLAVEAALAGQATDARPTTVPDAGERLVTASLVPASDGAPLGVLLVSRNLAYINQVESTVSYSRKLSALNRLTAGIAHEIKNPLNATMIHLELLRMELADREQPLEHVNVIARQVRRLDEVVQGFLKFTRPEDLHMRAVELGGVFDQIRPIVEAEAQKHRVEFSVELPPELPPVEGDATLLEQAFLNLALNACQAMSEGGRLTISAQVEPARRISIDVEDTGTGIAPEHLSKIFDLYFTTKAHGSGIGLSLVFRTVQLHNGEIEVQSTQGHGTRFRIHLNQASRLVPTAGG